MKNSNLIFVFLVISLSFYLSSCQSDLEIDKGIESAELNYTSLFDEAELNVLNKELDLPNGIDYNYDIALPAHLGNGSFAIDNIEATLGRVLFYDKELSLDRSTSCASCHLQEAAFAENRAVSEGLNNELGTRNSIGLGSFISLRQQYYGGTASAIATNNKFFWDERASTINEQMSEAFESPIEMGMDMEMLEERVRAHPHYQLLFDKAFSDGKITSDRIMKSIQTFMSSIHSTQSKFDKALNQMNSNDLNINLISFSSSENLGKDLFVQNCSSCHNNSLKPASPTAKKTANNGLDINYVDNGIGALNNVASKNGVFKIPPLKNVEVSYPYMHDGRFETLEEVIEFYSSGIQPHDNLDPKLKKANGSPKNFNFTDTEKKALVDFLKTLTDEKLLTHPKFSDPFKS